MKSVRQSLPRYGGTTGWTNRILCVDLSGMTIHAEETSRYIPDYLGARGIAAKVAWDEYPEPVEP
ncbi:MAG: hypothetical protein FJZ90_10720, partial [Chloroflexi bacterium]|nr:hypothetical protein [Chloroflexota bacterium]